MDGAVWRMVRHLNKLTALKADSLPEPGRHSDGGGLYLKVSKTGGRAWIFMYTFAGRQREMGLGPSGQGGVTLAKARKAATAARDALVEGVDPLTARKEKAAREQRETTTFGEFADSYVDDQSPFWTNPKHVAQWRMTLGPAYCEKIRDTPIFEVGIDEVHSVLKPVWEARPETARRLRMRLERVLDAARVKGLRSGENPARWRGNLDHILPRHAKGSADHHAAMPYSDVPAFFSTLNEAKGIASQALAFAIATAARTGEVLGATWSELDVEAAV